jgi:hypothetical protein
LSSASACAGYAVFWDIENCPVPKGHSSYDIATRVRHHVSKAEDGVALRELGFRCFANVSTLPESVQQGLHMASVEMVHVADRKPGSADRMILLALDRFERAVKPPARIVLITGDIDFVCKVQDLVHQVGYFVTVVARDISKPELRAAASHCIRWSAVVASDGRSADALPSATTAAASTSKTQTPARKSAPDQHVNREAKSGKSTIFACDECGKEFRSDESRRQHLESTGHSCSCSVCGRSFNSLESLDQHQRATGHTTAVSSTEPTAEKVRNNAVKHQSFSCPVCSSEFRTEASMFQHQSAADHVFPCEKCQDAYYSREDLMSHQDREGHVFKCNLCSKTFRTHDGCERHVLENRHFASCPRCKEGGFIDHDTVRLHMQFNCSARQLIPQATTAAPAVKIVAASQEQAPMTKPRSAAMNCAQQ